MKKIFISLIVSLAVLSELSVAKVSDQGKGESSVGEHGVEEVDDQELKNAKSFVQKLGKEALEIINRSGISDEQVSQEFSNILDEKFDMNGIARFVLGASYKGLDKDDRDIYLNWFKRKQIKEYLSQFREYSKSELIVNGAFKKSKNTRQILVNSVIRNHNNKDIEITWSVYPCKNEKGKYKIYDVITNNLSISNVQRNECRGLISKKGGLKKFLKYLKEENK